MTAITEDCGSQPGQLYRLAVCFLLVIFFGYKVGRSMLHTAFFHVHIVPHAWSPTGSLNAPLTQK
jgi:hypothetical protein